MRLPERISVWFPLSSVLQIIFMHSFFFVKKARQCVRRGASDLERIRTLEVELRSSRRAEQTAGQARDSLEDELKRQQELVKTLQVSCVKLSDIVTHVIVVPASIGWDVPIDAICSFLCCCAHS